MKLTKTARKPLVSLLFLIFAGVLSAQQPSEMRQDAPQTLVWVGQQAIQIEEILSDAMLMSQPFEIYERLADAYILFDAVAMAGLYCTEVRSAVEIGREQCDIIHFRLGNDLNTNLNRAVEARRAAMRMREAAKVCGTQEVAPSDFSVKAFTPQELLQHDAFMAEMDIQDGLASKDLHILSQKLEHAIRLLYDAKNLARTLNDCSEALRKAEEAIASCRKALAAPNWTEVNQFSLEAVEAAKWIQNSPACQ